MMNQLTTLRRLLLAALIATTSLTAQAGAYDDLIAAVYRDDTDAVMALLKRGLDVNSVDPAGNTLLHIAARNGNVQLLDLLLVNKANPLAKNKVGDTALMLAAYNGKIEVIDKLLVAGAELDPSGWTPLHYAVFASKEEIVRHLLSKGANINARAPNEQTPLMLAAKMGSFPIAKVLLDAKAKPELKDQHGETAITLAKSANNTDIARLIETASQPAPVVKAASTPAPAKTVTPVAAPMDSQGEYVSPPFQSEPAKNE